MPWDNTLCNVSAFRFYRIPPAVLMMLPPVTLDPTDTKRQKLRDNPTARDVLGLPLNLLVASPSERTNATSIKHRVHAGYLPPETIRETPLDINVTSPLFTLLSLATTLTVESLALVLYEMCGTFTVFKPTPELELAIKPFEEQLRHGIGGWSRIPDESGKPSNLWKRPPLVDIGELHAFIADCRGQRGVKRLKQAAGMLTGTTASPFEAQLSMLLSLPIARGGEGLPHLVNNHEVTLSEKAKRLCKKSRAYIDILLTSPEGGRVLPLECQGRMVHGQSGVKETDADRATALSAMGYDILFVTYSQISQRDQFDILRRLIFEKLRMRYRDKTSTETRAEIDLRRKIFIDWEKLGAPEVKRSDFGKPRRP